MTRLTPAERFQQRGLNTAAPPSPIILKDAPRIAGVTSAPATKLITLSLTWYGLPANLLPLEFVGNGGAYEINSLNDVTEWKPHDWLSVASVDLVRVRSDWKVNIVAFDWMDLLAKLWPAAAAFL